MTTDTTQQQQRQTLRAQLKERREALSAEQRAVAADDLVTRTLSQPEISKAGTIGIYFSIGAELSTAPLIQALHDSGKQLCLPVLHPFCSGHLLMLSYQPQDPLHSNRLRIPEPALNVSKVRPLAHIDTLLIPLLGFDPQGNRLGMGGGFYDRTLQSWDQGLYPDLTVFGLAYDCQQVGNLPAAPWDVPVNGVITPNRCWRFKHRSL